MSLKLRNISRFLNHKQWRISTMVLNNRRNIHFSKSLDSYNQQRKLIQSYDHAVSPINLISKTIGQVVDETVEKLSNREALVFYRDNRRITYAELQKQMEQLAAGLLALGLKKGDRIGIWGRNHMEWIITFYAAVKAGLIVVNVNPAYKASELEYVLNKVDMKALLLMPTFKTSDYYEILREITPELEFCEPGKLKAERVPYLEHVIVSEGPAKSGTFSFEEVMNFGGFDEKHKLANLKNEMQFDEAVNIQFTSGTTGNPKGITLTHHNLVNNGLFAGHSLCYDEFSRVCIPVPLYHCFGMTIGSITCMITGCTQIFPSRGFDAEAVLDTIHHEKCTSVYGTPTMFIDMLHHPKFDTFDCTSLITGVMAGSPCPIEVMHQIINKMHCKDMTIGYGLTETSPLTNFCSRDSPVELRVSTIGRIIPHTEVKIINEDGNIVPLNTAGELCYRGHNVMQGYWGDKAKTEEAIDQNKWFHTGDLGVINEDGYCKIVGRLKDLIIRGGENIYPTEVENFLHTHPKVEDVQVVGILNDRMGEEVCAWIKLKRDTDATADEIKDFCKGKISHFKIPRYIEFVEEYPMTVTGKVKKFEIRDDMTRRLHDEANRE